MKKLRTKSTDSSCQSKSLIFLVMKRYWLIFSIILLITFLYLALVRDMFSLGERDDNSPALCPVCKRIVIITETTPKYEYKGRVYYFNNLNHQKIFRENPEKFLK